jgi:hypothetical protein
MSRPGWELLGSQKNQGSTASLPIHVGSDLNNSASGTPGGGSSPKPSFRKRLSSFIRGVSNRSRNASPTPPLTPQDPNASNSPVPVPREFESERVQMIAPPDTLHRTKSNPIAVSSGPPTSTTDISPSRPRITESLHSHISPTIIIHDESLGVQLSPGSEATDTLVVGEGPRERTWKDNLRTAYNGFSQVLNIAAESSDVFPPLKSVLGGVRAVLKAVEVRSHQTGCFRFSSDTFSDILEQQEGSYRSLQ